MKKERMMLPVALLQLNEGQLEWMPKNPRQWTQDGVNKAKDSLERDPDFLDDRPLLVVPHDGAFVVYAGNMRLTAARELGVEALPCVSYEPESVEDRDTIKRRAILDNGDFGAWDWDALANEWDDLPLGDWGVPNWPSAEDDGSLLGDSKDLQNPYSTKLESPIYEIRGERPDEGDIVDTKKVDELLAEIKAAKIPEKVKTMLRVCAYRHAVIDFEGMAEYYAHAPKEVQQLMENSALVIIDFDGAVERGFVKMTADLQEIYDKNTAALYGTE